MLLGDFHPALGEKVFVLAVQFGDDAVLESGAHAVRHVAVADDAGGDDDRRIGVACGGALQFLAEHHAHMGIRNLVQTIHEQQGFALGNAVEDDGPHDVRLFREQFRLVEVLSQEVSEATAKVRLTQVAAADKHRNPRLARQRLGIGNLAEGSVALVP